MHHQTWEDENLIGDIERIENQKHPRVESIRVFTQIAERVVNVQERQEHEDRPRSRSKNAKRGGQTALENEAERKLNEIDEIACHPKGAYGQPESGDPGRLLARELARPFPNADHLENAKEKWDEADQSQGKDEEIEIIAHELVQETAGESDPVSRLLDHMAAEISFDRLPWDLSTVELRSGGLTTRGQGSFDPLAGTLDLRCTAELDPELTGRYVERYPQLRSLVDGQGRLSLPLRLDGSLMGPSVGVEVSRLIPKPTSPRTPSGG